MTAPTALAEPRTAADAPTPQRARRNWLPFAVLLGVAALLRLYHIDSQLWLDEVSALLASIRRPLIDIATRWPGVGTHPFYELWAHVSLRAFGETPFAVRLPAALFGIAGVGAMYRLAARVLDSRRAFFVAALFALSYHHIFFSQDARGYTALVLFFLLATDQLVRFYLTSSVTARQGVWYAVACTLAAYSQLVGIFIVPGHALVVLALAAWRARGRGTASGAAGSRRVDGAIGAPAAPIPLRAYLGYAVLAGLLTAALYAPFAGSVVRHTERSVATPAEGPRFGFGLAREIVEGLSAALMGPVGLAAAVVIGTVGVVWWLRRHPVPFAALVVPVLLQAVVFVVLGVGIHPRYFGTALPIVYLFGGTGVALTITAVARRLPLGRAWRERAELAALAAVLLLSATPLLRYYRTPKQDFAGAAQALDRLAGPSDTRIAVFVAASVLNRYYDRDYVRVDRLDQLRAQERTGRRLLLVTTLERVLAAADPALYDHIRSNYRRVMVLPATVGDGEMRIYEYAARARD